MTAALVSNDVIGIMTSLTGPIVGHVGDGNFHSILLVDGDNVTEVNDAKLLASNIAEYVLLILRFKVEY